MKGFRIAALAAAITMGLGVAFHAGTVYAADQRLHDADAALEKAIALLKAAENPGVEPPFGGHDRRAKRHMRKAREQVALAIAYADGTQ